MRIGIPKERRPGETRVAATPETVKKLVKAGHEVLVEREAGVASDITDAAYEEAGAQIVDTAGAFGGERGDIDDPNWTSQRRERLTSI